MNENLRPPSGSHRIFVIGASAGGVEALKRLVPALPRNFPAPVFIVLHIMPHSRSFLPAILSGAGMSASHAVDGDPIEPGRIYIAPPNCHLLVELGHVHVSSGPKENRHRPAVNPLFRSAALAYGPRVVGIILTGTLDDGTVGLWEIKRRGGIAVVQDPLDAIYPGMPQSAIENVDVDHTVKLDDLPDLMMNLAGQVGKGTAHVNAEAPGRLTTLTCPECRGPLHEHQTGRSREFRCRVGHVYAPQTMLDAHAETIERTLWSGVVALEEGAELSQLAQDLIPNDVVRLRKEEKLKRSLAKKLRTLIDQFTDQASAVGEE